MNGDDVQGHHPNHHTQQDHYQILHGNMHPGNHNSHTYRPDGCMDPSNSGFHSELVVVVVVVLVLVVPLRGGKNGDDVQGRHPNHHTQQDRYQILHGSMLPGNHNSHTYHPDGCMDPSNSGFHSELVVVVVVVPPQGGKNGDDVQGRPPNHHTQQDHYQILHGNMPPGNHNSHTYRPDGCMDPSNSGFRSELVVVVVVVVLVVPPQGGMNGDDVQGHHPNHHTQQDRYQILHGNMHPGNHNSHTYRPDGCMDPSNSGFHSELVVVVVVVLVL